MWFTSPRRPTPGRPLGFVDTLDRNVAKTYLPLKFVICKTKSKWQIRPVYVNHNRFKALFGGSEILVLLLMGGGKVNRIVETQGRRWKGGGGWLQSSLNQLTDTDPNSCNDTHFIIIIIIVIIIITIIIMIEWLLKLVAREGGQHKGKPKAVIAQCATQIHHQHHRDHNNDDDHHNRDHDHQHHITGQ